MVVRFQIPGEPKGKARPRVFRNKKTGKSQAITPQESLNYENLVKWIYQNTMNAIKFEGAVEARIVAIYGIPKSMTKKNRKLVEEGKLRPTKKPDVDNIAKIILDSLNGIAYNDDSQVVRVIVDKEYGENPRVEVCLWEYEAEKK